MSTNTVILVRLEEAYLETTIGWGRRQVNLMFTQYYNVLKTMSKIQLMEFVSIWQEGFPLIIFYKDPLSYGHVNETQFKTLIFISLTDVQCCSF